MKIDKIQNKQNFGMAKLTDSVKAFIETIPQPKLHKSANEILQRNLERIEQSFPDKYLHCYECGDRMYFRVTSAKKLRNSFFFPPTFVTSKRISDNTPLGVLVGCALDMEAASAKAALKKMKKGKK